MEQNPYPQPRQFIGGHWRDGGGDAVERVLNPATEDILAEFRHAGASDIEAAIEAAQQGFARWRHSSALQRSQVLRAAADRLRDRNADIARQLTREQGKPCAEAQREIALAADMLDWYAEEGKRVYGRVVPSRWPGVRQTVRREPIGPVAAFTPWNMPILIPAMKIGAALAAGCSVVFKPSEETPAAAMALVQALVDAGVADGALNLLLGQPGQISQALITAPAIRKVSFTGSTAVGKQLAALAGAQAKRIALELGGHAPVIVCADADPVAAAQALAPFKFRNAGQICISPTRFLVHDSIYQRFAAAMASYAGALSTGDGMQPGTQMGPLANARRLDAMHSMVDNALSGGARLLCGGRRLGARGYFYAPTVLADVADDARIMNEEPFGPLAPIDRFDTLESALTRANRLPYGLAAYAFTNDLGTEQTLSAGLEAGMIGINSVFMAQPETPFGGVKDSGDGRESGIEGVDAYLISKFVTQAAQAPAPA